jgi:hypothetical protein
VRLSRTLHAACSMYLTCLMSFSVVLLLTLVLPGNLLSLGPVLGLWVYSLSAPRIGPGEGTSELRCRRRNKKADRSGVETGRLARRRYACMISIALAWALTIGRVLTLIASDSAGEEEFGGHNTDSFIVLVPVRPGRRGTPEIRPACGHRLSDGAHDDTLRRAMENVKGIPGHAAASHERRATSGDHVGRGAPRLSRGG